MLVLVNVFASVRLHCGVEVRVRGCSVVLVLGAVLVLERVPVLMLVLERVPRDKELGLLLG